MADIAKICGVSIDDIVKINGLAIDDISKFCGLAVPAGGEWKPTDIAGCVLWVDASQVVGLNDGDTLSSWDNLTGGADLAAYGSPKYKTNIQNMNLIWQNMIPKTIWKIHNIIISQRTRNKHCHKN